MLARHALDEERHRVHAEAGDAQFQPEADHLAHLLAHGGVRDVQVRLEIVEAVVVVLPASSSYVHVRLLTPGNTIALLGVGRLVFDQT